MLANQGSVFLSEEWEYNGEDGQIHLKCTGTESHNSLGIGEKCHSTLRSIYSKTICDQSNLPDDFALAKSVQAMNKTTGPHGLLHSLLVFRAPPQLPKISPQEFPRQKERLLAAQVARKQYEHIVSKSLVQKRIRIIPTPAAIHVYSPGEFAYIYREGRKHHTGQHLIASVDGKCAQLYFREHRTSIF